MLIAFASPGEAVFVAMMLVPLAFFGVCALYLCRLLLAAIPARAQAITLFPPTAAQPVPFSSAPAHPAKPQERSAAQVGDAPRFVLLIPAHNEELLLGAALDSLSTLDYPRDQYEVVVIADNCSDSTAAIARRHGATALERFDTERIGKGYALEWALEQLSARSWEAVVILDADTQVSQNLLRAFASGMAAGQSVMQARYEVLNAEESWRTRLMACALALAHIVKPLGREQLGLSDGLKGNGMCFVREVVARVPWSGASITEDIEYTLRLCRAGYRVAFLPNAAVWAQMPTTGAQATSQRKRWEGGRYSLLFTVAPRLLSEGIRTRRKILRDRAAELIIPPFAELFALPIMLLAVCALVWRGLNWSGAGWLCMAWLVTLGLEIVYLAGGMWVARVPASVALSLLRAPFYIVWKFGVYGVMAVSRSAGGWKRTERREF